MHDGIRNKILVVDDDPNNLKFLQEILKERYKVYASLSGERALKFLEGNIPDLILLDVEMPGMNGYELIQHLKANKQWMEIPVIFLTAAEGREKEQKAFELGAVDYVLKPISPKVVLARVGLHIELQTYRISLEQMVERKTKQLQKTQDVVLEMLSNVTAIRDNETGAHIKRTTVYTQQLVDNLLVLNRDDYRVDRNFVDILSKSAKLHDIGKIAIPDRILLKPDKLTTAEFQIMKEHTVFGARILDEAINELGDDDSYFLYIARRLIISHHEWWDGSGYPYGLKGSDIPLSGRIMALADVYDALISKRPYKEPYTHEEAIEIILSQAGTHFDPVLVEISKPIFDGFEEVARTYKDEHYQFKMLTHMDS